jgi:hypothetical protein
VAKHNIAEVLRSELAQPRYVPRLVNIGSATDCYQPVERELKLTRSLIEVMQQARHPFSLITKSSGVERDLDLLAPLAAQRLAAVYVTITTLDPVLARRMEPRAAAPHRRLRTIRALADAGVPVGVSVAPQIPFITEDMEQVLEAAHEAGARSAFYTVLRLPWELDSLLALEPYGHYKAKIDLNWLNRQTGPDGKLVLVTAISPTPAGEGKTTTTVGLGDALNRIGKRAVIALREPSLGPVFGMKGGAAGGGYAQVVPMEDINLHFTGDFSAIALAHNLLCRAARQPHPPWQCAGHRCAAHRLAPRDGHERPGAALHRGVAGRAGQRVSARGRFRHRRGLRGHGHLLPGHFAQGPEGAAGQHHRGLHPRAGAQSRAATCRPRGPWRHC